MSMCTSSDFHALPPQFAIPHRAIATRPQRAPQPSWSYKNPSLLRWERRLFVPICSKQGGDWRLLSQAPFPYSVSACVHPAFQTDQRGYQTFRSVNFFCRFHFLFSVYILISFLSAELQRSSQDSWNRGFRGSFVSVSQCRDGQFLCSRICCCNCVIGYIPELVR